MFNYFDKAYWFVIDLGIEIGSNALRLIPMALHAAFMQFYDINVRIEDFVGKEMARFFFGF